MGNRVQEKLIWELKINGIGMVLIEATIHKCTSK